MLKQYVAGRIEGCHPYGRPFHQCRRAFDSRPAAERISSILVNSSSGPRCPPWIKRASGLRFIGQPKAFGARRGKQDSQIQAAVSHVGIDGALRGKAPIHDSAAFLIGIAELNSMLLAAPVWSQIKVVSIKATPVDLIRRLGQVRHAEKRS